MLLRRAAWVCLVAGLLTVSYGAWANSHTLRVFVDGAEVHAQPLAPGIHDLRLTVTDLLDESFTVEVPNPQHIVIDSDTTITGEVHTLRPGDSVEFRNGARLMIGAGASVDWQGSATSTWSNDGLTQNLTRDVRIFGQGDIMFAAGSEASVIRYVEVDLQPVGTGRYPLHWHFVGDGSRGTLVEGVVVKNSTNRAYVPHASHGITFRDVIAKTIAGPAYWWDGPAGNDQSNNSNDITYDRALADGITNAPGDTRGFRLSAFDLGAGTGNVVRDSVARNITPSHVKDCSGFMWPEISIHQPGNWVFEDNKTIGSACHGIFTWQNVDDVHIVDGFFGTQGISHGAYVAPYDYRNVDVPYVIIHATGWSVTGGSAGYVTAEKHQIGGTVTFTDVAVDFFEIRNNWNSGTKVGHYVFDGTGLDCADVWWRGVVAGTTVTIDGVACLP